MSGAVPMSYGYQQNFSGGNMAPPGANLGYTPPPQVEYIPKVMDQVNRYQDQYQQQQDVDRSRQLGSCDHPLPLQEVQGSQGYHGGVPQDYQSPAQPVAGRGPPVRLLGLRLPRRPWLQRSQREMRWLAKYRNGLRLTAHDTLFSRNA
jgi:hypothetical protein